MTAGTAETQVVSELSVVSKVEIEDISGLDMSPYQDLTKSNGINPDSGNVDENSDSTDNSYVFVNNDPVDEVIPVVDPPQSIVSSEEPVNSVQASDVSVDSLVKDTGGEVQVAMVKENDAKVEDVMDQVEPKEIQESPLVKITESAEQQLIEGIMVPNTDTKLELVDASETTESQAVVSEAENKESVDGDVTKTLLPDISDANDAEIEEIKALEVDPLGQESQIVVSDISRDNENKESNDLTQTQNDELVFVAETGKSGEETKVITPLVKESAYEDKEINGEVQEKKDAVDTVESGDNGEMEILLPDLVVKPGEEIKAISPLVNGDEIKEVNNEIQETESRDLEVSKILLLDSEKGDNNKEVTEGKIVEIHHEVTDPVGNQTADNESLETNLEEQNDFESGIESCEVVDSDTVEASIYQPEEVIVESIKEESKVENEETQSKSEERDSQDLALNAPESALKEVDSEQQSEVKPLEQVKESEISQVPEELGSDLTENGREKESDAEEKTDLSSDAKEIHVPDTQVNLEAKSLDNDEDDSHTSECAQKIEDESEISLEVNESESNGDQNLLFYSKADPTIQLASLSDANKDIEDVQLSPVNTVESETIVENNQVLQSDTPLESIDSGEKVQSKDLDPKALDKHGDVELSNDVKESDSQVENSSTRDNGLIEIGTVLVNISAVDKESASNVVVTDVGPTPEQNPIAEEEPELMIGVTTKPFTYLIRIPRFDDEKIRERVRNAQLQVEEKTKARDVFRLEIQKQKVILDSCGADFEATIREDRDARRLVKRKRIEIDSLQALINRVKNAISIDDIDARLTSIGFVMQHETIPLKDEKEYIREMKQLKQLREQLSSNIGSGDEVQQAVDQKDQIEARMKVLKKDLEILKTNVVKAQEVATNARRKYDAENKKFKELQDQFKAADSVRQEAYVNLQGLRRELYDKNKEFRMAKEDASAAYEYAQNRKNEAVHRLCVKQVDEVMKLWNNNAEFRKEYVKSNVRSTVRRLGTLDGRSLGQDEEPPVLPSYITERPDRSMFNRQKTAVIEPKREVVKLVEQVVPVAKIIDKKPAPKVEVVVAKKAIEIIVPEAKNDDEITVSEEEVVKTKEEIEAEELRKQEEAAKLKELRRKEEIAKAKEAHERKLRNDRKAQIKAELRAQKEAEQKEKEREKRQRKKERKKAVAAEDVNDGASSQSSVTQVETIKEVEVKESQQTVTKRAQKPSQFVKMNKTKSSIPPPLRNRNKRRMQQWMWVISTSVLVVVLFFLGNIGVFSNFKPRKPIGF